MSHSVIEHGAGESEDRIEVFEPVLSRIRIDTLLQFASSIWKKHHGSSETGLTNGQSSRTICNVVQDPIFGSNHAVVFLEFGGNVRWVLKLPEKGIPEKWTEIEGQRLRAEALTMRLLRLETTIPVPEVYAFDATFRNELRSPFILMEFIDGIPLHKGWFNGKAAQNSVARFRARLLQDLAKAMWELRSFRHKLGGTPVFDEDGRFDSIGPINTVVNPAPFTISPICTTETQMVCEVGPFTDMKEQLFGHLRGKEFPRATWDIGIWRILLAFTSWIPFDNWKEEKDFVLAHPSLDFDNVLVSDKGELLGLIDWNGVATVPRCIGSEAYPSWLTQDWNPSVYNYDCHTRDLVSPKGCPEDAPEELAFYRDMCAELIDGQISEMGKGSTASKTGLHISSNIKRRSTVTSNSILVASLAKAASKPLCAPGILEHIFHEISRLTADDWRGAIPIAEAQDSDVVMQDETLDVTMNSGQHGIQDDQSSVYYAPSLPPSPRFDECENARVTRKENGEGGEEYGGFKPVGPYNDAIGYDASEMDIDDAVDRYFDDETSSGTGETATGSDIVAWGFSDVVYAFAGDGVDSGMGQRLREGFDKLLS